MKSFSLLVIFFIVSCSNINNRIEGHWYLVKVNSDFTSDYVEFIIQGNISKINKGGFYWYDEEITLYGDDSIKMGQFLGKIEFQKDTLVIFDNPNSYCFKKLEKGDSGFTNKELTLFRKFKYEAKQTSVSDSLRIKSLKYDMWVYFGGAYKDSVELDESLKIVPARSNQ